MSMSMTTTTTATTMTAAATTVLPSETTSASHDNAHSLFSYSPQLVVAQAALQLGFSYRRAPIAFNFRSLPAKRSLPNYWFDRQVLPTTHGFLILVPEKKKEENILILLGATFWEFPSASNLHARLLINSCKMDPETRKNHCTSDLSKKAS